MFSSPANGIGGKKAKLSTQLPWQNYNNASFTWGFQLTLQDVISLIASVICLFAFQSTTGTDLPLVVYLLTIFVKLSLSKILKPSTIE